MPQPVVEDDQRGLQTVVDIQILLEPASALFGALPRTEWLSGTLERDDRGFILTGADFKRDRKSASWPLERDPYLLETSIPGVFAAGHVRYGSGMRVATAVGEGAMAVLTVWQYRAKNGL